MSTYVLKNNEQLGPFDDAMIFTCLADGRFLYEDLAWREGWANWRKLREVYPAPAPQKKEPVAAAAAAQKASGPENTLWTGRPSYWSYMQSWVLGLAIICGGIWVQYAGEQHWLAGWLAADYPQWNDVQPWLPLIVIAIIGIGVASIVSAFIARLRRQYTVTNQRLVMRWGLFAVSMAEIRIQDIRSINVAKKGLSGFLLDIGTVEFASAATDMADVTFWQIAGPYKIRDIVRKLQA